jgi:hypothetical protein
VRFHLDLKTVRYQAAQLKLPMLVYQGLGGRHPFNSDRHHTFIMEGAREVQQQLQDRGIGHARWEKFKRHGLKSYSRLRNVAAVVFPKGVSRPSAYLHHGHVSPFRIAKDAARDGSAGAVKFLDEPLIWRELAHHFCFHRNDLATLDSISQWARQALLDHQDDPREVTYSWERSYRGQTGDVLRDAAQKSLLVQGELHNNVRMTWGKAMINWARHPQDALDLMIDLNHRFALDILRSGKAGTSICPSQAARKLAGGHDERVWRPLMEPTRRAARRLAHRCKIRITQGGKQVNPSTFKGPIRLELKS